MQVNCWFVSSAHHPVNPAYETGQNQDWTCSWKSSKRALQGHLHHEFSPPAVVLICHLLQTLDHLLQGGDQVEAPSWLQERTHCLDVQHGGIEHYEVVSVRNKPHTNTKTEKTELFMWYAFKPFHLFVHINSDIVSTLYGKFLWIANVHGLTIIQWASREHPV